MCVIYAVQTVWDECGENSSWIHTWEGNRVVEILVYFLQHSIGMDWYVNFSGLPCMLSAHLKCMLAVTDER